MKQMFFTFLLSHVVYDCIKAYISGLIEAHRKSK